MGLIEQAVLDVKRIVSDPDGFGQQIQLIAPDSSVANVVGLHKKIRLGVDTEGNIINSLTASITVSDVDLVALNYPYRNSDGQVDLDGHLVNVNDVTGNIINYSIQSWHPDETVGVIVCFLQFYSND